MNTSEVADVLKQTVKQALSADAAAQLAEQLGAEGFTTERSLLCLTKEDIAEISKRQGWKPASAMILKRVVSTLKKGHKGQIHPVPAQEALNPPDAKPEEKEEEVTEKHMKNWFLAGGLPELADTFIHTFGITTPSVLTFGCDLQELEESDNRAWTLGEKRLMQTYIDELCAHDPDAQQPQASLPRPTVCQPSSRQSPNRSTPSPKPAAFLPAANLKSHIRKGSFNSLQKPRHGSRSSSGRSSPATPDAPVKVMPTITVTAPTKASATKHKVSPTTRPVRRHRKAASTMIAPAAKPASRRPLSPRLSSKGVSRSNRSSPQPSPQTKPRKLGGKAGQARTRLKVENSRAMYGTTGSLGKPHHRKAASMQLRNKLKKDVANQLKGQDMGEERKEVEYDDTFLKGILYRHIVPGKAVDETMVTLSMCVEFQDHGDGFVLVRQSDLNKNTPIKVKPLEFVEILITALEKHYLNSDTCSSCLYMMSGLLSTFDDTVSVADGNSTFHKLILRCLQAFPANLSIQKDGFDVLTYAFFSPAQARELYFGKEFLSIMLKIMDTYSHDEELMMTCASVFNSIQSSVDDAEDVASEPESLTAGVHDVVKNLVQPNPSFSIIENEAKQRDILKDFRLLEEKELDVDRLEHAVTMVAYTDMATVAYLCEHFGHLRIVSLVHEALTKDLGDDITKDCCRFLVQMHDLFDGLVSSSGLVDTLISKSEQNVSNLSVLNQLLKALCCIRSTPLTALPRIVALTEQPALPQSASVLLAETSAGIITRQSLDGVTDYEQERRALPMILDALRLVKQPSLPLLVAIAHLLRQASFREDAAKVIAQHNFALDFITEVLSAHSDKFDFANVVLSIVVSIAKSKVYIGVLFEHGVVKAVLACIRDNSDNSSLCCCCIYTLCILSASNLDVRRSVLTNSGCKRLLGIVNKPKQDERVLSYTRALMVVFGDTEADAHSADDKAGLFEASVVAGVVQDALNDPEKSLCDVLDEMRDSKYNMRALLLEIAAGLHKYGKIPSDEWKKHYPKLDEVTVQIQPLRRLVSEVIGVMNEQNRSVTVQKAGCFILWTLTKCASALSAQSLISDHDGVRSACYVLQEYSDNPDCLYFALSLLRRLPITQVLQGFERSLSMYSKVIMKAMHLHMSDAGFIGSCAQLLARISTCGKEQLGKLGLVQALCNAASAWNDSDDVLQDIFKAYSHLLSMPNRRQENIMYISRVNGVKPIVESLHKFNRKLTVSNLHHFSLFLRAAFSTLKYLSMNSVSLARIVDANGLSLCLDYLERAVEAAPTLRMEKKQSDTVDKYTNSAQLTKKTRRHARNVTETFDHTDYQRDICIVIENILGMGIADLADADLLRIGKCMVRVRVRFEQEPVVVQASDKIFAILCRRQSIVSKLGKLSARVLVARK